MELTVDQALQKGVSAHGAGNLQEAERLYRFILQFQPAHPDANHNLGVLAVSVNKPEAALPFFKTALEENPNIEQFWLSYADALMKENRVPEAEKALAEGKKNFPKSENFNVLEQQLQSWSNNKSPPQSKLNNLLEKYQNARYEDAEAMATSITREFPGHQFGWKMLGVLLARAGKKSEALSAYQKAVHLAPQDAEAHNNLGTALEGFGRFEEAKASYRQSIALKPDYVEAHNNLGNTLKELGRLEEAEACYRQALSLKSDYAEGHNNLGNALQELSRFEEAEACYVRAVELKADYAEAHNNLGNVLQVLGRLEEAEASYRQSISLKSDYAEAHNNLGATLQELGRLDEAETCFRQAIELEPGFALAHQQLGTIHYINGDIDSALESMDRSRAIDPRLKSTRLLLAVLKSRKFGKKGEVVVDNLSRLPWVTELTVNSLSLNRVVEAELIASLYKTASVKLKNSTDARHGNGICSPAFDLFDDDRPIIKAVAHDLKIIMREAVKAEVFIMDSFFNIFVAGSGASPHRHINNLDVVKGLGLERKKYSLVYYLCEGDQSGSEPGTLRLYDPSEDILPYEGMITIIPAGRRHSAAYDGGKDRVMIGVNFYSL